MEMLICPIGQKRACDGEKVSCPHCKPHESIGVSCGDCVCSRLNQMSNKKPACIPITE
jgi:hypothetical protein